MTTLDLVRLANRTLFVATAAIVLIAAGLAVVVALLPPAPQTGDPRYGIGIAAPDRFEVRRETDGAVVATHEIRFPSVSADGRYVAYAVTSVAFGERAELFVAEVADPQARRKVLELRDEVIGQVVWTADGTGLAIAVRSSRSSVGAVPEYVALRTVDLASGQVRERARLEQRDASPLVWDRADVLAGVAAAGQKGPGAYVLVRGNDVRTIELEGANDRDIVIGRPQVSSDGRLVAATWSGTDGTKSRPQSVAARPPRRRYREASHGSPHRLAAPRP